MSESRGHDLLPPDEWVSVNNDGYLLLDPVSGRPLEGSSPDWMTEDWSLSQGQEYLNALPVLAPGAGIHFMFTDDEIHAESIGPIEEDYFEYLVGNPENNIQAVIHTVDGVVRDNRGERRLHRQRQNAYTERISMAALSGGAMLLCAGLEIDSDGKPVGDAERTLQAIGDLAALQPYDPNDKGAQKWAMDAIARTLKQSYRTFKVGERMMETRQVVASKFLPLGNVMILAPIDDSDMRRQVVSQFPDSNCDGNADESQSVIETSYDIMDESKFTKAMEDEALIMASGMIMHDSLRR